MSGGCFAELGEERQGLLELEKIHAVKDWQYQGMASLDGRKLRKADRINFSPYCLKKT